MVFGVDIISKEFDYYNFLTVFKNLWHPVLAVIITILISAKFDIPLYCSVMILLIYLIFNLSYQIYEVMKRYNILIDEYNELKEKHSALSIQYEKKSSKLDILSTFLASFKYYVNDIVNTNSKNNRVEKFKTFKEDIDNWIIKILK